MILSLCTHLFSLQSIQFLFPVCVSFSLPWFLSSFVTNYEHSLSLISYKNEGGSLLWFFFWSRFFFFLNKRGLSLKDYTKVTRGVGTFGQGSLIWWNDTITIDFFFWSKLRLTWFYDFLLHMFLGWASENWNQHHNKYTRKWPSLFIFGPSGPRYSLDGSLIALCSRDVFDQPKGKGTWPIGGLKISTQNK